VNPVPIDITPQPRGFFVPTEAIPDQEHWPLETSMAIPTVMDQGVALWGPGARHRGVQHEPGLVNKNDGAAFPPGFF
jgi:hypothetical protein